MWGWKGWSDSYQHPLWTELRARFSDISRLSRVPGSRGQPWFQIQALGSDCQGLTQGPSCILCVMGSPTDTSNTTV